MNLKHLVVVPGGGLCNRLCPIASAKRLCTMSGAKCTVIWDWGKYTDYFLGDDAVEVLPRLTSEMAAYRSIRHLRIAEGGNEANRVVPLTEEENIVVFSQFVFGATEEPPLHEQKLAIRGFLPQPSDSVHRAVSRFREQHFDRSTVGIHLRRTDHELARWGSPDSMFIHAADRLVKQEGCKVFLATDNLYVQASFQHRYGAEWVCCYPKNLALKARWPRDKFDPRETFDDVVDLFLLASCQRVIGSRFSRFSRIAATLNGSPQCALLGDLDRTASRDTVNAVAITPKGGRAVSASNDHTLRVFHTVRVWELESGKSLDTRLRCANWVDAVAVTPDGRFAVSASEDHTLRVWELESGKTVRTLQGHSRRLNAIAVTSDGCRAVSASKDHTLRVWELESGKTVRTLQGHSDTVNAVAITPDGRFAVSASWDNLLRVWELEGGQMVRTLDGHSDIVTSVTITSDGRRAVSASWDNTLRLWELESGEELVSVTVDAALCCCAVSLDGRTIFAGEKKAGIVHVVRLVLLCHVESSISSGKVERQ